MKKKGSNKCTFSGPYMFALAVGLLYGIFFWIDPEKTFLALGTSAKIFGYILLPLSLVFVLMVLVNLFLRSSQVTRLLGEKAGFRGIILSAAAGIISMGPIYAWFPLLKEVKERGAGNTAIAVFLGNRAVKPFLLPIMISYFGWIYVLLLTFFMFIASVVIGYALDAIYKTVSLGHQ
ncbi:MAG: hypothetical protein K8R45_03085, partial [Desulfobacterales bacterium]|nr:hypothetical protein [Desulfobacterales bacterium]